MLVRFKSDVGGFTMFGDVAVKLLRMSGHSASVPGAIPAQEIATALAALESGLAKAAEPAPEEGAGADADADPEREPPVPLARRAFPLIELMRNALREKCGVMWDRA